MVGLSNAYSIGVGGTDHNAGKGDVKERTIHLTTSSGDRAELRNAGNERSDIEEHLRGKRYRQKKVSSVM